MPLDGWDYVELWVGNAKQAAYFYEHALGFTRTAYAGPETGVRDRASYVLEQGSIRFVVTSALREDHDIARHCSRHGDGVKDIALTVPDATEAYRQAVQRGARGTVEPHASRGRVRHDRALRDRHVRRHDPHVRQPRRLRGAVQARVRRGPGRRGRRRGRRARDDRPHRRQRRARPHGRVGRVLRARVRDDRDDPLLRRGHLDRVLGADVEGDERRLGEDQVPAQRAGRGQAQEPDRGVPRLLRRARARSTSRWPRTTSSARSRR